MDGPASRWPLADLQFCDVLISVTPATTDGFHVIDCETYDYTPDAAFNTVVRHRTIGEEKTIYCNRSTLPDVRGKFQAAGVYEPPYWLATADGIATIPSGVIGVQYKQESGCDVSIIEDYWPGVDVTNPMQLTDILTFPDGTVYTLRASGEVQASKIGEGLPIFHTYTIKGDDGDFYTFGPDLNSGVFAYPGLPANERQGVRSFYEIRAGSGRW